MRVQEQDKRAFSDWLRRKQAKIKSSSVGSGRNRGERVSREDVKGKVMQRDLTNGRTMRYVRGKQRGRGESGREGRKR